jgi:hypothetical protein
MHLNEYQLFYLPEEPTFSIGGRLVPQVIKSSQVKVMTLTFFKIPRKSKSLLLLFSKYPKKVKVLTLTLT